MRATLVSDRDARELAGLPRFAGKVAIRDGNAFAIIGAVSAAIKAKGATSEEVAAYRAEAMSGDYGTLLVASGKMINLD
jgi:hypothetical protein